MLKPLPYLDRLEKDKDFVFITDHGGESLSGELRLNVREMVPANRLYRLFLPQWLLEGLLLFFWGTVKKRTVYVTFGSNMRAYVLMTLQALLRPLVTPKVHVLFGCLWEPRPGLSGRIIIVARRFLVHRVVAKCIVNGKSDIEAFNQTLGISKDKLVFFPYHHTLQNFSCSVSEGDYVFSGGTDGRDYELLLKLCDELSIPVKIATLDRSIIAKAANYPLADVKEVTPQEFRDLMAGSRLVTIPYGRSILRTGGHQTMINAMLLGKALICYNEAITDGYILNGKTGISIPYGNIDEYKAKLHELYHSKGERERLGRAGRQWVLDEGLTQIDWTRKIYDLSASFYYERQAARQR